MSFVLDASVALAWAFEGEGTPVTEAALEALREQPALVPTIWYYEIGNALVVAQRRGRLTAATAAHFVELLGQLPITAVELAAGLLWGTVSTLAREQGLSVYDAAYLELAMRKNLPLATEDQALREAAGRVGVVLLGPAR